MSEVVRPRRSLLYMPASNDRALEKARNLPADGLIFDLEDAVTPASKVDARNAAVDAASSGNYGKREIFIRVNSLDTAWGMADMAAVSRSNADGVIIPKIRGPEDVTAALVAMESSGAPRNMRIWCMIETPMAILRAAEIAENVDCLGGFFAGTADLAKDLQSDHPADRAPMVYALQKIVLTARAFGLAVIDGVHVDLDDQLGFENSCRQGRAMGFDGKTLIHPKQIDLANHIFSPSEKEISQAKGVVSASEEAKARGDGVTVYEGRLVEQLHVEMAKRIVVEAEMIAGFDSDRG